MKTTHCSYLILCFLFFTFPIQNSFAQEEGVEVNITHLSYPSSDDGSIVISSDLYEVVPDDYIFSFAWTGDNGFMSNDKDIFNLVEGEYCVEIMTSTAGNEVNCPATACFEVGVSGDFPTFSFEINDDECTVDFYLDSPSSYSDVTWDFGDGAIGDGSETNHYFEEEGCYDVTMKVDGVTSNSVNVCVECDFNEQNLDCDISGEEVAAIESTISLTANIGGANGSLSYNWEAPSGTSIIGSSNSINASFQIGDGYTLNNGNNLWFEVTVCDEEGNCTECSHAVEIAGIAPDIEITAWGYDTSCGDVTYDEGEYAYFTANTDGNVSGTPIYTFEVRDASNGQIVLSQSEIGDYDFEFFADAENIPLGNSYYVCVSLQDDTGSYGGYSNGGDACVEMTLCGENNNPGPPTNPPFEIKAFTTDGVLIEGAPIPEITLYNNIYEVDVSLPIVEMGIAITGAELLNNNSHQVKAASEIFINNPIYDGGVEFYYGTLNNASNLEFSYHDENSEIAYYKFIGGAKEKILTYPGCYDVLVRRCTFDFSSYTCVADLEEEEEKSCIIKVLATDLTINDIDIEPTGDCNYKLSVDVEGGFIFPPDSDNCGKDIMHKEYNWRFFSSKNPNEEIDIFDSNSGICVEINKNKAAAYYEQFGPYEQVSFIAEVTVLDHASGVATFKKTIQFENDPLRYLGDGTMVLCSANFDLKLSQLIWGGSGQYLVEVTNTSSEIVFSKERSITENINFDINTGESSLYIFYVEDQNNSNCFIGFTINLSDKPKLTAHASSFGTIDACDGPSLQRLGAKGGSASGGFGEYSYQWTPTIGLDNPASSNPIVSFENIDEGSIGYTLIVTDEQGCTASDYVKVSSSTSNIVLKNGHREDICYGETEVLGKDPILVTPMNNSIRYEWKDSEGNVISKYPNPLITSQMSKEMESGIYTVTAWDVSNGCYDEQTYTVNFFDDWKHQGLESSIYFIEEGESMDFWKGAEGEIFLNPVNGSGAEGPITFTWAGAGTGPINEWISGEYSTFSFSPTTEDPYRIVTFRDDNECYKDFQTNRAVITDGLPEVTISLEGIDGNTACMADFPICYKLALDLNLIGGNAKWMFYDIPIDYTLGYHESYPLESGSNDIFKSGTLFFEKDENTGLYHSELCIDENDPEFLAFFDWLEFIGSFNHIHLFLDLFSNDTFFNENGFQIEDTRGYFVISSGIIANNDQDVCNDDVLGFTHDQSLAPPNVTYIKTMTVSSNSYTIKNLPKEEETWDGPTHETWPEDDGECYYLRINENKNLTLRASNFTIVQNLRAENGYFHAYIDPCENENFTGDNNALSIPDDTPIPDAIKQGLQFSGDAEVDLLLAPNPFNEDIRIGYVIDDEKRDNSNVTLRLLDVMGKHLTTLIDSKSHENGQFTFNLETGNLPPGIYFYELIVEDKRIVRKAVKINNE